jgi:DMSO reductase anchor subunit
LLVFTFAATALVSLQTAVAFGVTVPFLPLALVAVAAAGFSTLHLGRPERAWRAMAGFGSSWLSREIVIYSAFVALLGLQVVVPNAAGVAQTAAVVGWLALLAVDRVYDPVRRPRSMPVHSADVLGMAALLTAVLLGQLLVALVIAGVRLLLFGLRQTALRPFFPQGWARTVIRIIPPAVGLALMALGENVWTSLILISLGEIADRLFFYLELQPTTISESIVGDLMSMTSESTNEIKIPA